jgi:hypothetical protein
MRTGEGKSEIHFRYLALEALTKIELCRFIIITRGPLQGVK